MLKKKILYYFGKKYPGEVKHLTYNLEKNEEAIFNLVFKNPFSFGNGKIPASEKIYILSSGRPRWAIQLNKLAGKYAAQKDSDVISLDDIDSALDTFGKTRLEDLYKEFSRQCPQISQIIESFIGSRKMFSTYELLQQITNRITNRMGQVEINGIQGNGDSISIAHFLYKIGFILGRNGKTDENLPFVEYAHRPDLLKSETNLSNGLDWEIHPAFHKALHIE